MSGVPAVSPAPSHADGTQVRAPGGGYLPCQGCGSLLYYLTWYGGRALCRRCIDTAILGPSIQHGRGRRRF